MAKRKHVEIINLGGQGVLHTGCIVMVLLYFNEINAALLSIKD